MSDAITFLKELNGLRTDFHDFGISAKEYGQGIKDLEKKYGKMEDVIAEMQKEQQTGTSGSKDALNHPEIKTIRAWMQTGNDVEFKAKGRMSVNDAVSGGVLAPPVFVNQILERLTDMDVLRQYANVIAVNGAVAQIPFDADDAGAQWVGENETRNDTGTPTLGVHNVQMNDVQATVPISVNLLNYGIVNVEQYVSGKLAEKLSKTEGAAFVGGDGFKKPQGLFHNERVETIKSGSTTAINRDAMIDLWGAVPTAVDQNGRYVMNKKTAAALMKLKTTDGVPLWNNAVAQGMPPTFNGFEVILTPSAPDIAAGKSPVIFGDIRSAYAIVDGMDLSILRDEYSAKRKNLVEFTFTKSVGGQVVMPSSIRKMVMSA